MGTGAGPDEEASAGAGSGPGGWPVSGAGQAEARGRPRAGRGEKVGGLSPAAGGLALVLVKVNRLIPESAGAGAGARAGRVRAGPDEEAERRQAGGRAAGWAGRARCAGERVGAG